MQKVSELQWIRLNGFAPNIESLKPRGVNLWDLRDLMDDARRIRPVGVFKRHLPWSLVTLLVPSENIVTLMLRPSPRPLSLRPERS